MQPFLANIDKSVVADGRKPIFAFAARADDKCVVNVVLVIHRIDLELFGISFGHDRKLGLDWSLAHDGPVCRGNGRRGLRRTASVSGTCRRIGGSA